jgi:UDP-N-acetylenolpyruvoylglucosamine reductase|tara:strand:- start:736 stop:2082 length:1347 start_codon:yes stop_codon:yes gene_type:complete
MINKKKINNWSRTINVKSIIFKPKTYEDLKYLIQKDKYHPLTFRGSGCSYGDCALNSNGSIVDLSNFNKILEINTSENFILVQSGLKIENLLNSIMPLNYFINNIPGSNNATIGGCINSNVSGKDSFKYGNFSNNIECLKVMDSDGNILTIEKKDNKFQYSFGTYGLIYIILESKIKIKKINSSFLKINTFKFKDFDEMLNLFEKSAINNQEMMGAWVNHFDIKGSGIFKSAIWDEKNHLKFNPLNFKRKFTTRVFIKIFYPIIKILLVNRFVIKYLNYILLFITKEGSISSNFENFFFSQQKKIPEESKLYCKGKINIQILIPENNFKFIINKITYLCHKYKYESWWLGIKKHKGEIKNFYFEMNGFDITLQWSKKYIQNNKFNYFYKELIKEVINNKCLIYLTQDILLNKNDFQNIYKEYYKFKELKNRMDPNSLFQNNLYNRLLK